MADGATLFRHTVATLDDYDIIRMTDNSAGASMFKRAFISASMLVLLNGCATMINGSHQTISVTTNPPGATCAIQQGASQWNVLTPGTVQVMRKSSQIVASCSLPGYQTSAISVSPGMSGWAYGSLAAGGLLGVGIDNSTGDANKYPDISLALQPNR